MNVTRVTAVVAGGMLAALLAAGCDAQSAAPQPGTVQACADYGVRAIERHVTVTWMPAACRGLSRAQVNQAVGQAIYIVAGGRPKAAWRRRAYLASAWLAYLTSPPQRTASSQPRGSVIPESGAPAGRGSDAALRFAALVAWLLAAGSGSSMVGVWISQAGIRRLLTGGPRLQPVVIVGHFALAAAGLVVWIVYLAIDRAALAWTAVGLLLPVAGLGMALVTLGSSGDQAGSGTGSSTSNGSGATSVSVVTTAAVGTLTAVGPRTIQPRVAGRRVSALVVIGHGLLAAATLLLVLLAALGAAGS